MRFRSYLEQQQCWPQSGRHVLAQYDAESIYVYQAYRPSIASFAVEHQHFGGEFSFNRMSWIKPNFLWMMYRSGWATKEGQERILAIQLPCRFFDELLGAAVPSTFDAHRFTSRAEWQSAVGSSEVRIQWDPDHDPTGAPTERRAVQLGLRGSALRRYAEHDLISIEDITPFVVEQRLVLQENLAQLQTPEERVYLPSDFVAVSTARIDPTYT